MLHFFLQFFNFFSQAVHLGLQFGQMFEHYTGAHEVLGINGRRTLNGDIALTDTAGNTGLGSGKDAVANDCMTGNADLTTEHTPLAYLGRTGHANLGGHDGVFPYFAVVGHLHQIVQLHSPMHHGATHRSTVNTGIGTDFYIVLNRNDAYLRNLLITFSTGGKAEAICSNHATGVKRYTVT